MLVLNKNLLQRVRVITIALVTIVGFGTIAMKPAAARFDHIYGVVETDNGTAWEIRADVTDASSDDYQCINITNNACSIGSDSALNIGDQIPVNEAQIIKRGLFVN